MKKNFRITAVVAAALLGLASCSSRDLGLSPMVPDNALGFVQITDAEKFIANSDAFILPLGLTALTGNLGVRDLINIGMKTSAKLDITDLDLKKPLGFAVLPPEAGSTDVGVILYVPLLKPEETSPKLEELFKQVPGMNSMIINGYGIYYNGAKKSFPPAKSLAIPESLAFEPGTITAYAALPTILSTYKTEYEEAKKMAMAEMENSEQAMGGSAPLNADMAKVSSTMMLEFFKTIDQIKSFAFNLKADAVGFSAGSTLEYTGDGSVSKLIKELGSGKNIAALTKYIPAASLISGAISGNPLAFKELNKSMMDLYFAALQLDEPTKAAFLALTDDSLKLAGKNSAFSLDIGLSPAFAETAEEDIAANISTLFTVRAVAVGEITNGDDYKKFLSASVSNGAISGYINKMLEPSGFALTLKLEDVTDGDFSYQVLKFDLKMINADKIDLDSEAYRGMASISEGLLRKFTASIAVKNNHVYLVMGDDGAPILKKLATSDAIDNSVEKNEHWITWLKTVPQDSQFIGNLSLGRIFDIVKIATKNDVDIQIPEADKSGIFSYVRATGNRIDSATFWSLKEITPLVKAGMKDSGGLMDLFSGGSAADSGMSMSDQAMEETEAAPSQE